MLKSLVMWSFIPLMLQKEKIKEFLTLNMDYMSVHEYCLNFTQLSRYATEIVVDMSSRMSIFVADLYHR